MIYVNGVIPVTYEEWKPTDNIYLASFNHSLRVECLDAARSLGFEVAAPDQPECRFALAGERRGGFPSGIWASSLIKKYWF